MENNPTPHTTKKGSSHSNFRRGLSDYHDGDYGTHYLGNDDYDGASLPQVNEDESNEKLSGKEAFGNQDIETLDEDEE